MAIGTGAGILGAAAIGGAAGLMRGIGDLSMSSRNQQFQRDSMATNLTLQKIAWGREDNAVQRRMADLKKAGLSPTLAAGSAAGASGPIQIGSQEAKKSGGSIAADVIQGALSMSQLSQTVASTALVKADTENRAETKDLIIAQQAGTRQKTKTERQNTRIQKQYAKDFTGSLHIPPHGGSPFDTAKRIAADALNAINNPKSNPKRNIKRSSGVPRGILNRKRKRGR